jgi:predicted HicB family RNase H-like nuclease
LIEISQTVMLGQVSEMKADKRADSKTLTVRLDENVHRRLKTKLLADRTNFQARVQAMLEEYVDCPPEQREEIARRR